MNLIDTENNNTTEDSDLGTTEVEVDSQSSDEETSTETTPTADAQGQSDNEDSFFDPNTVPEELKGAYKQMQAAFTKKTQEIAQAKSEAESVRQKADAYSKYEQYVPILEEMLSSRGATNQQPELKALAQQLKQAGYDDSSIEAMTMVGSTLLNIINGRTTAEKQTQFVEKVQGQIAEAAKLDSRLNDTALIYQAGDEQFTFGQMVEQIVGATPNWEQDPISATKKAIARVDALIGKAKQDGKQELSASASAKARQFPANTSSPQGAKTEGSAKTIQDAFKEAKAELEL